VAGAAVAAVWTAHRCVPLNVDGYEKIIGESIEGGYRLYEAMHELESFMAGKMTTKLILSTKPVLKFVVYVWNAAKNRSHQCAAIAVSYGFHRGFTYEYARTPDTASRHI
jgi:hypothetical protein